MRIKLLVCVITDNSNSTQMTKIMSVTCLRYWLILINKRGNQVFTCEFGLVVGQSFEAIGEGGEDTLHCPKHGAETQVEQHEEEEC